MVLQHWCRNRDPGVLILSLIMQLISSPIFDASRKLHLHNGPTGGLPGPYDLCKLVERYASYLLRTLKWIVALTRGATVYCVLDSFRCWEDRMKGKEDEKREVMAALLDLVRLSCADGEGTDFRLLLMGPRFEHDVPQFATGNYGLEKVVARHGVVLGRGKSERTTVSPPTEDISDDSENPWHTASEDAYYSLDSDESQ